jgi:hypothetical protein
LETDDEKLDGGGRRLLDLFMGLTAEKLALTVPSPTWNVASPQERIFLVDRTVRELKGMAPKRPGWLTCRGTSSSGLGRWEAVL